MYFILGDGERKYKNTSTTRLHHLYIYLFFPSPNKEPGYEVAAPVAFRPKTHN